MDAVEQAANAGDYAAAEPLLREAALLQEASLGPLHPDVANTLNNLAVVCSSRAKWPMPSISIDAPIGGVVRPGPSRRFGGHQRKEPPRFCETQGLPLELPKRTPVVAPEREAPVAASAPVPI